MTDLDAKCLEHNLGYTPKRSTDTQRGIQFNCKCHYTAEEVPSWKVRCEDEPETAVLAFISLQAALVSAFPMKMLLAAAFAERDKRTFFIAKAMQICL
jgi:hypothetical protein